MAERKKMVYVDSDEEDSPKKYDEESEEEKYEEEESEAEGEDELYTTQRKIYVDSDEEDSTPPSKKTYKKPSKKVEEKIEEEIIDPEFLSHIPSYTAYANVQRRGNQKDFGYISDPTIEKLRMVMQQINSIDFTFDENDIEIITGSGSNTRNIDVLNPVCYVLGYTIVDKNGDINKTQIDNIFSKILKNLDTKIEQPDIIRYARLWAQTKRTYKHISI